MPLNKDTKKKTVNTNDVTWINFSGAGRENRSAQSADAVESTN